MTPLVLAGYDLKTGYERSGWLGHGVVLGSVGDFDALLLFWNLRAAGAPLIFYDQGIARGSSPMPTTSWRASANRDWGDRFASPFG
jgi:hypothetical protein